ncbi:winged helix-turn-helix transcriptional regulator [Candidatus Halocynthiibacter alkanivorans]|uniref:winged helix-turn-helix transcriptional regulator n=1 Tax=Candidatus Halocynthiibacter alkanivorans TaxID=2267619 RepID=UPI001F158CE2|nr:helix-turn-helix domain-containing protein [Candidatus Halocynthiibacter alkanivorans]
MKFSEAPVSCPMDGLLRVISGPWTTYILWRLATHEIVRFGELKRLVSGISSRVLTERLRKLEDAGLVHRDYKPTIPPEVSYSLTERGLEMRDVLNQLNWLSQKWQLSNNCMPLEREGQAGTIRSPLADAEPGSENEDTSGAR